MDFLDLVFLTCLRFLLALYCCHLFLAEDGQRWSVYILVPAADVTPL